MRDAGLSFLRMPRFGDVIPGPGYIKLGSVERARECGTEPWRKPFDHPRAEPMHAVCVQHADDRE